MKCPSHIAKCVRDAAAEFPTEADEHHCYYQLLCSCGCTWFRVIKSRKPSLAATCRECAKDVIVYDVDYYPAATARKGSEIFEPVIHPNGQSDVLVYVMFEYGEVDNHEEFDENDISWCQVFVENEEGIRTMILDDETS